MPELAELVTVDLARKKLFVNGVEFPWHISEEGPKLDGIGDKKQLRAVTLTFFTKDIQVIPERAPSADDAGRRPAGQDAATTLPDLTAREHEIAADECEAIASYFDRLAELHDGPFGVHLAGQHSMDARTVRSRGRRHQERAQGLPRGALEFSDEEPTEKSGD